MPLSIFNNATRGLVTIRDLLKTGFAPSIGLSDDSAAFAVTQTTLNPTGGATVSLVKTGTIANVNDTTFTSTISVNGTTELTGKVINTIGPCTSNVNTAAQGRVVRGAGLGIGVQAGDLYTIGLQVAAADNS